MGYVPSIPKHSITTSLAPPTPMRVAFCRTVVDPKLLGPPSDYFRAR